MMRQPFHNIQSGLEPADHYVTDIFISVTHSHGGVVLSSQGDCMIAAWNALQPSEANTSDNENLHNPGKDAHQKLACMAAVVCASKFNECAPYLKDCIGGFQMAISTSPFFVGIADRTTGKSVHVFGSELNTLEQLLSLNKVLGTSILITEQVC